MSWDLHCTLVSPQRSVWSSTWLEMLLPWG